MTTSNGQGMLTVLCTGWKCCKPRVLSFDEFLAIPPCTTGKHSDVDDSPAPEAAKAPNVDVAPDSHVSLGSLKETLPAPAPAPQARPSPPPAPPEDEDDDPSLDIAQGALCKRRGCGQTYTGDADRAAEQCVHHPGVPIFHEGSKGYSCCKRRVLEFDQFLALQGCKTKDKHMFVGSGHKDTGSEESIESVRSVA